ncbi:MAG: SulP family inorganic anion transporter [Polyangiales bacterium]
MKVLSAAVRGEKGPGELGLDLVGAWAAMARDLRERWGNVVKSPAPGPDLLAGLTVAAVALPLNVALAVASGLPPSAGLIAGAVGGGLAAVFGGAPFQVTGPAAALNVMVLALMREFGATGVAAACLVVGVAQLTLAASQAGGLMKRVPESVLAGFTTGVGLKLLDNQIPEVLGFDYRVFELAQMMHRPAWLHHVSWLAAVCGLFVAFMVTTLQQFKRFPAAIVAIATITFVSSYLRWDVERVGAVTAAIPRPALPVLPDERWLDLVAKTVPLALLAGVESLLSARAIDRMKPDAKPHNPNLELFGQGVANLAVGLMQGMPVSGVIVRSSVNVQSGARTRMASVLHAVFLGAAVLYLGRFIARVPLAALAGLLCVVGWRLIEAKELAHLARTHRLEAAAFAVTAAGTVTGHLITGLAAGLLLHALHRYLHRHEEADRAQMTEQRARGIRAVLTREDAEARRPFTEAKSPEHHTWLRHVRERPQMARTAFVHKQASVIGRVVLGDHVHIAAGSSVRADEGTPFFIGANSNIQDGVVIHALKDKHVRVGGEPWAVYVGRDVSMAHDALVHGPCYVGDGSFVGFKAVVHDAVVGEGCFIGIGAVVVGVELPPRTHVPHGTVVDSADAVARLPRVTHAHTEFNEDVVDVNRGLAAAYHALDRGPGPRPPRADEPAAPPRTWDAAWGVPRDPDRF